jgi:hypothetical protein
MNAKNVRINLRCDRADMKSLPKYARTNDVERNGGYLRPVHPHRMGIRYSIMCIATISFPV